MLDKKNVGSRLDHSIVNGIEDSSCFVLCLSKEYAVKADDVNMTVAHELNYTQDKPQNVIILLLDETMKPKAKWTGRIKFLFWNYTRIMI